MTKSRARLNMRFRSLVLPSAYQANLCYGYDRSRRDRANLPPEKPRREHWQSGYEDTKHTLMRKAWLAMPGEGVMVRDVHREEVD
jgi:hypothetical protein